jgi:putative flippase GtrA
VLGFIIPALAIAYSLATSAYAVVNLPPLLAFAQEKQIAIPIITSTLVESGVHLAGAVSLLLACTVAIPCFLTSRTSARVIGCALACIPSFILSSLIFLAVFAPQQAIARAG